MATSVDASLGAVEFRYGWYRTLLSAIREEGYRDRSFGCAVESGTLLLRHDIDLSLSAALRMAKLEAGLGIESTYFVLLTSQLYNALEEPNRSRIRRIEELGHDVGLHFSTHEYPDIDESSPRPELESHLHQEKEILENIIEHPVGVVSFHRPPEWVLGRPIEGLRSTYAPRYFSEIGYVADSGQRWRSDPPVVETFPDAVQLLAHPGLWGREDASFEERVKYHIDDACEETRRRTNAEFLDGGRDR